ncbi:MAG TPA: hypothetical protein VNW92_21990 [Polyangiaceae bacterium]|jgi:hypothetical protein|nr:hypothetical protein [Polyangiaceae bacterium]
MTPRALSALLGALTSALLLRAECSRACSCSGQGPASALTRPDQTWGVRASERVLLGQGAFNAHGNYAPFAAGEHDRIVEYDLLAAYRLRRWELSGTLGYGARIVDISGEFGRSVGLGDAALRARYEVFDEPAFWQDGIYPALALLASLGAATGSATGVAPRGLGANELALGISAERSFGRLFRAGIVAQGAARLPDTSLGVSRRLGPRAGAELTLSYFAEPDLVVSGLVSVRWEGNVTLADRLQSGTAQRWSELGAALSWQPWDSAFRAGFAQRYAPGVSGLGANTVQSTTTELWLGYVR